MRKAFKKIGVAILLIEIAISKLNRIFVKVYLPMAGYFLLLMAIGIEGGIKSNDDFDFGSLISVLIIFACVTVFYKVDAEYLKWKEKVRKKRCQNYRERRSRDAGTLESKNQECA